QIGALQSLLDKGAEPPTPLQRRVTELGKYFVTGALLAGGIVAAAGLMRGIPPAQLLISAVTLAASAIPEGLPLTITIALTAGVMRMAKRKAVVRKLASLESLGRVTVICSDKTGTLTRNEMTVKELATTAKRVGVTGDGYTLQGEFYPIEQPTDQESIVLDADFHQLLRIGLLCNNASLEQQEKKFRLMGDPTEKAILTVAMKAGIDKEVWHRHREIPFDSSTGSMSVVCEETDQGEHCLLLTKGSPESILRKCDRYLCEGEVKPLTEAIQKQIEQENMRMAEQALRVLGFAYRPLEDKEDVQQALDEGLIYVGLMGMIDPPREDVRSSIEEARALGIKPVMITGDHPITARAIGEQLSICRPGDQLLTGTDIDQLSLEKLVELVPNTNIFARVTPEHKLRIVEAFQRGGEVVAMMGDGVNDAPAIRKADVGIAMGSQGTDLTKDTAGIVLMEDHFHSIIDGVKEGRKIIGNIRKSIGCLISGNLAEVLVATTAVVIGLPMPLIPLQILLMNLLTDALPAIVLATDSKASNSERHKDVIDRSLYRTVLTRGSILGLSALGVFAGALALGVALPLAQTITFATLVAGQIWQTVSWRRLGSTENYQLTSDRPLLLAMLVSWAALLASIYLPGLQGIFATSSLRLPHWFAVIAVSGAVSNLSGRVLTTMQQREHRIASSPVSAAA
ncbi:MAG: Cation-transporting ATPase pacL, partial [Bacilli bacterium]|nr:Cation-transporting ATPase pacL [Bacilli bacterium]